MRKLVTIILAIVLMITTALVGCTTTATTTKITPTQVPYQQVLENFLKDSPTYKFDGIEGSIKFTNIIGSIEGGSTIPAKDWEFTIAYQTAHPGHGDRTGQVLAQVVTNHTAVIKVKDGEIISAICENEDIMTLEEIARQVARQFIENSSTFKFDGVEESIKYVRSEPGGTSGLWSAELTYEYQTRHPGHDDRTGKVLAEVITNHTAKVLVVKTDIMKVARGICDKEWDMVNDKNPPLSVTGTIISGGDTTPPGGPVDAPRIFLYEVKRTDGTIVKVSYTAYPPSPVGNANRAKITLEFYESVINIGDKMEALGRIDKQANTIVVATQGDYIRTYPAIVSEEVSWNIGETIVAATITRPNDIEVHPAIVFVPGSGPTDRDWNTPLLPGTNGSARLLAEELARSGYVTIRYDKRFIGTNAEKNMAFMVGNISMESHVEELAGAVDHLLSRSDVNPQKIFVVANSEGNIHAMNYQSDREPKFAGLVLIAPPGRNLPDIMHTQIAAQIAPMPNAEEIMAAYDKGMDAFLAGEPFMANPVLPQALNDLIQSLYNPLNLPFTRELFLVDGSKLLSQVTAPTLVVIGKKDIQIDWQLDGAPLETVAAAMKNVTFVYPENANHVLKNELKPRTELTAADGINYNAADKVLDPDGLKAIKDWLTARS
ncbi:MAG TPA: alpha/beta fold hydrolase [Dehalococcoidales bacterium]|nr:alpha/beta fold hydrolase [Dehalococcoidales bacterium]